MVARRRIAAVVGAALLLLPAAAIAQEPEAPAPPPLSAEALSVLGRLDGARAAIARLQAASDRSEYERARAEIAVVDAHKELAKAAYALELVGEAVTKSVRAVEVAQRQRLAAQELLDADAATTYKFNGARGAAMLFELMGTTDDPNAFARDLYALESVMVRRQQEVARLMADVAAASARLETFTAVRGSAYLRHVAAEQAVEEAEQEAAAKRAAAADAEQRLVAAAEAALALELVAAQAQVEVPPAPPGADIPAAGSILEIEHAHGLVPPVIPPASDVAAAVVDAGPLSTIDFAATAEQVELRRTWLGDRVAELAEERSLDRAHRRAQPNLTCAVEGAEFSNDWHYPRSHGRRHKGIDMLAPFGTPVLAPADGVVTVADRVDNFDGDNDLGGIALTYETAVGRFYASHLQAIPDGLAEGHEVKAGDVIGWVGDSGNAKGGPPHLHLGWYVGEVAVNPFPTMALVCSPPLTASDVNVPVL